MSDKIKAYIDSVLDKMLIDERMKIRIEKDLYSHIYSASESESIDEVLKKMGDPKDVAREFMNTIYEDKEEVIEQLIKEKTRADKLEKSYFEYKSKIHIFSLPLVHIKLSRSYGIRRRSTNRLGVAKGIIAIGDMSKGVISIGCIALGGISIGGLSLGIVSFGGLSIGLLALGGFAIGGMAVGGIAIGIGAIGGLAIGDIAVGGYAKGNVAIGDYASGNHVLDRSTLLSGDQAFDLIKSVHPKLSNWIIRLFTFFLP
ncbi:MAG TPA: hypothetical protein VHT34_00225 [Clostridia bacterium]|nr:hypothetical protein [Clostridia bacterium]